MGSQFSSGFVPSELRQHVERPLARVKVLFDAFKRLCRDDFQNNGDVYYPRPVPACFRHGRGGSASTLRVLGSREARSRVVGGTVGRHGAVLRGTEELKINFCFCELLDLDKDGALNEVELRLLLQSVSTGVARLKQIRAPPPDLIDSVVQAGLRPSSEDGRRARIARQDGPVQLRHVPEGRR